MTEPTPLLSPPDQHPQLEKPKHKSHITFVTLTAAIIFVVIACIGIASRAADERNLKKRTQSDAVPIVATITVKKGAVAEDVVLPGTVQAWHAATIYARTAGYLKSWNFDIGAHVKAGDVLAEIEAPDLDAQFHQAQADLNTAEANNKLAQITAKRYIELLKSDSVSKQQVDTQIATAEADQATVESQKANLDHLQQQENFKTVVAPFDGTITQRNTDVGALINGGNSSSGGSSDSAVTGQDLFHIADTSKLRVYVQVPENYSNAIKPDLSVDIRVPQHLQQVFPATLTRTADALDPATRTLLIELEVDNADAALLSGAYTDVDIKIPSVNETVLLPVNALLFRDNMHAAIVKDNHVTLKSVRIGRDYGKTVEIVEGLSPGDVVVINPPDSLEDGQEVRIKQPDPSKNQDKSQDTDKPKDESKSKDKAQDQGEAKDKSSGGGQV